ncbi:prepilin-type N-terminal cleavage/methylation domain-containing protein [Candidatus Gracilibacteria bacterium]|nr:prepilin-type N-terminal cleavage/methylation domain-containing protein [Candidatus Gracilibacteria bacterium]
MKKSISSLKNTIYGFTLVELIVAATILVILTTIGFYSYTQNISSARDGSRKTALSTLSSQLVLHKRERGSYPIPGESFEIHNRGGFVALQGKMDRNVGLTTADTIPLDPDINRAYTYSVTSNRQEYQLAATLENNDINMALLLGDYKSVSKNILPTIILALSSTTSVEINESSGGATNRQAFIFDENLLNLPYDFINGDPVNNNNNFADLLSEAEENNFWQSSDFRNCSEIAFAAKRITPDGFTDQYQVRNDSGQLVNQNCSCDSSGCTNTP